MEQVHPHSLGRNQACQHCHLRVQAPKLGHTIQCSLTAGAQQIQVLRLLVSHEESDTTETLTPKSHPLGIIWTGISSAAELQKRIL